MPPTKKTGKRILAIDDDPLARDIYEKILVDAGYDVVVAADGKAGVAAFKAGRFDCVILDIYMPGMSGLDVLEALDPDSTKVPVIAVSGGGGGSGAHPLELASTLGAARSFGKDFDHEEFLKAVKELTGA
jgi:DNA-binding response OmpR family regulator